MTSSTGRSTHFKKEVWDPLRWAPKIGGCTPNRASKAGTLGVRRVFCPAHVRAKNELDFIPALARAGSLRRMVSREVVSPTPKAFPLGGRWAGEAGSDEGAIWYPTFPCRKEGGSRLSPQRGFSIAPLGNPVAPSSVTFGDSFPPRGSLWVVQPYTKKRPKSGHADGCRNSPSTGTMWHPTPKRASANERALKVGGRGPPPATLCVRAFSRESLDPRPGPGGNPPRRF